MGPENIDKNQIRLTARQKNFLSRLVEIYHELKTPVHYSVIARSLGLSSSTAYDMLRVLEEKGMVSSQYKTDKKAAGPGRASIVFRPSVSAIRQFIPFDIDNSLIGEWKETRASIINSLENKGGADSMELVNALLRQSDKMHSPMASCALVLTALMISFRESRKETGNADMVDLISKVPASGPGISSIASFMLGLLVADRRVRDQIKNYQEYIGKYISFAQDMSQENLNNLHELMMDVCASLWPEMAFR